ncbi:MAG: ROK family transcriptional regulator [Clostridiales bacterium]|nr:ROK family transcriptional regulator [Clostridiales bacterium]
MLNPANITQDRISDMNRVKILRKLRDKGQMTRFDLSSSLGLSHTTINTYIQQLIGEGLVETLGTAESMGGRKPLIIRLVKNARYSFGVNISFEKVEILLVNLLGDEIERQIFSYGSNDSFDDILEKLREKLWQIIKFQSVEPEKILGVGIAFPGRVDDDRNLVEYAPNLGIRNYSFEDFQKKLGLKLHLENEANVAAYAEQLAGNANGKGNIVYVSVAEGIGAGIIIQNYIYKSTRKKAGEFGHIRIMDAGLACKCGRKDCWELYASKPALLKYYSEFMLEFGVAGKSTLEALERAYAGGETAARLAVEKYAGYLFMGIENILLALNPDEVIIGGELGAFSAEIIKVGVDKLGLNRKFYGYEDICIHSSGFRANGAVTGSAMLPLEDIYNYQKNVI